MNPPNLNPILGWALRIKIQAELGRVGRVHLAALGIMASDFRLRWAACQLENLQLSVVVMLSFNPVSIVIGISYQT